MEWSWTAEKMWRYVKALTHPYPGAFLDYEGRRLYIWEATPVSNASDHSFVITAGDGNLLRIDDCSFELNN